MKRLVFLKSRVSFQGGLEKYTRYLIRAFAAKGCEVTLLTTGKLPLIEGVKSVALAPDSKFALYHLIHFNSLCLKWLEKNPHEIVFGMERTTSQTHYRAGNGVHAVYLRRRQLVDSLCRQLTFAINPLHRILLSMEKKAFEDPKLKVLFTNSRMVKNEILNTYATPAAKIEVVHNGVEWQSWSKDFEQTFYNKKQGPFQLLFVGNNYKRKGLLFLLQGLERLKKADFQLKVIGKDKNPSYFIDWVSKKGLKDKVIFLGPQNDMLPFYQTADALAIPSIYDPFANVTIEALAMGLFVISSLYNGGQEVLQDYSGTVIQELTSAENVAAALKKAFDHPKTEARARRIRQSIKELDFSSQLDKIVRKTLETPG
jgi:UDP-glucose:(heptosyl)LPS alpha-1,3-glucosyltransferase